MDRLIKLPALVAVFAALALAGMIGIFAFNAAQTQAAVAAEDIMVAAESNATAAVTTYTITFQDDAALQEGDTIVIAAPSATGAGGAISADESMVSLNGTELPFTSGARTDGTATDAVNHVSAIAADSVTITLMNDGDAPADEEVFAADTELTVMITMVTNPAAQVIPVGTNVIIGDAAPTAIGGTHKWTVDSNSAGAVAAANVFLITQNKVDPSSMNPGSSVEYVVTFWNPTDLLANDWIEIQFPDKFSVPGDISASSVSIRGKTGGDGTAAGTVDVVAPPQDVEVDGGDDDPWEIRIHIGDMSDADALQDLDLGLTTVILRKSAGIKNPTEALAQSKNEWTIHTKKNDNMVPVYSYMVPRTIGVSSEEEPRGEEIVATAKGFKKNTTVTFFAMPGMTNDDDEFVPAMGATAKTVCSGTANSDSIAECSFTLIRSLFGDYTEIRISAVDGVGNMSDKYKVIKLDKGMSVSPQQANVGDTINIRLVDFGVSATSPSMISISFRGSSVCSGNCDIQGLSDSNGEIQFDYMIPSQVRPGSQVIEVTVGTVSDDTVIAVGAGDLSLNATNVLPNQRVSISASGFTRPASNQVCTNAQAGDETVYIRDQYGMSAVTLGGQQIPWNRINNADPIEVTSGGGWSAPIDLPIDDITTDPGTYELKIVDCHGGQATVDLTFPERTVTMTPEVGRVGSEVVVSGTNFPVANDEYADVDVTVTYHPAGGSPDSDDVETDALGNFHIIMEVPEDADIPSNNTVRVSFDAGTNTVDQSFVHRVPQGTIAFSATSGTEGSLLTITATGFARYTSVDKVQFGNREITPASKPGTGRTGDAEFDVRIPGADPGIYIIRVEINDVVATQTFTVVTGSGVVDGSVETILANVISEEALDRIFKFDNMTKEWQWYINDPAFSATNNLAGLSSGDLVWIKVHKTVTADVLGTSMTLTCINEGMENEDCWNQVSIP